MGSVVAWVLGLLALLLAGIGAFGVSASMVEERRQEIGIRMALGAASWQVIRLVLNGAVRPVLFGVVAGMALSAIVTPVLRRALYGMSPFDPIAYLEIVAILMAASIVATWIPGGSSHACRARHHPSRRVTVKPSPSVNGKRSLYVPVAPTPGARRSH